MLELLVPTVCPGCGRRGSAPCAACWRQLKPAPSAPPPPGVAVCRSLLLYDGLARELIARLKYRNARSTVAWLGRGMADLVAPHVGGDALVTWAPTSTARRRDRGFDQAELLARAVARELGLPLRRLLRRVTADPQTGRPATARAQGVEFARTVSDTATTVVIVDDVVTTGATLSAAARAIVNGGTTTVVAATAASTPLKLPKP